MTFLSNGNGSSGDRHLKATDRLLTQFGEGLKASEEFRKDARQLAHQVCY